MLIFDPKSNHPLFAKTKKEQIKNEESAKIIFGSV